MDWQNKALIYFFSKSFVGTNTILIKSLPVKQNLFFSMHKIFTLVFFFSVKSISCTSTHNIEQNKEIHWTRVTCIEFKMIKLNICLTWFCDKTVLTPIFWILYTILCLSKLVHCKSNYSFLNTIFVIDNSMSFIIQSITL